METIEVTPIAKLRPYTKAEKIKIRVCRIWKSSISATNNAVEASASGIDCELVASKIDASSCYEIMNFRTIKIREQYKVVPHKTQVIFTGTTLFKKLSTVFPPIPRHRFFLLDFNMLYPRLNRDDVLTDVIGHITAVQQLESKQINQRIVQKCDIHIEYIRKEELSVTLWADIAEAFCSLSIQKLSLPIIVVFTSLKVKIYLENIVLNSTSSSLFFIDPDIPEVNSYKSMFFTCKVPVKILPPSSRQANEAEILRTASRVTIDELAFLDPDLYKSVTEMTKLGRIGVKTGKSDEIRHDCIVVN
ncbi:hypothetical protein D8674_034307 [Pyrus ussuriensis x Pyrus communis]|uniref:Uncharacterized protein n=1 Tax=Pyrus ussuriensis x Pyrus communis TaxID=2448454 RepID=A0A5N5HTP9_9ROSA|nr:hypothetical protein D8674_034307 [Pyrus ussuriensis x Pyrus communis]